MSESPISDLKLKTLWKQAITTSLSPDNEYPAYKLYYLLLRDKIIKEYCKSQSEQSNKNEKENLHN